MPREAFKAHRFSERSEIIIAHANSIIEEYQQQGLALTLRQLYYQFVARGLLPNKHREYKNLGNIISDARLAGLIDWNAIEDRTRNLEAVSTWDSPQSILRAVAEQFRYDPWKDQDQYCEVWVEKEALAGVVERACNPLRVPYFSCRGYTSQSEQWRAGHRLKSMLRVGKEVTIFHLGDHDPSGIDMTRDNDDRLAMFARSTGVRMVRLALNEDQIKQYNPPPNPVKLTDSRAPAYTELFGDESWELDALDPKVLNTLITKNVKALIDEEEWERCLDREEVAKDRLHSVATAAGDWTD